MTAFPPTDEDEITKLVCTNCGHPQRVGAAGGRCLRCHRAFSSTQQRANSRRLSSSHVGFGAHAAELAAKLEARCGAVYTTLAAQGRELEAEFSRWATTPPEDAARGATISGLADWSRQAMDLLTTQR